MTQQMPHTGAWAPLAHRMFALLFIAQFVSNIGTWMQTVGAQWFLVEETGSSALTAWINTATTLPVLLLSLFAGVLADLVDRKRLLFWLSIAAAAVGGVLTVLAFTGLITPTLLLAVIFLLGCDAAIVRPAWQAIQPELVPRDELPAASSLSSVTVNGARAIGPAIAGAIIAASGPTAVFAINTVSYLAVAAALLVWRRPVQRTGRRERMLTGLIAGIRYVRAAPSVLRILQRSFLFTFPASALWALLPSAADTLMASGSAGYSLLLTLLGVGAVVGVLIMPPLRTRLTGSQLLALSAGMFALGTMGAALLPLWAAAVVAALAGVGWILSLTTLNAGMQLVLPAWVRARGLSAYLVVFMGSQAVGSFLWGAVSEIIGLRVTLLIAGALLLAAAASVALLPMPDAVGRLDLNIVPLSTEMPGPFLDEDTPDDHRIVVRVAYVVAIADRERFLEAMHAVSRARRRTGAIRWALLEERVPGSERRADETCCLVEEFEVGSWTEHELQHLERWTASDAALLRAALALTIGKPVARHYLVRDEA